MNEILEYIRNKSDRYYIPGGMPSFLIIMASAMSVSYLHFSEEAAHSPIHFIHYYLFYLIVIFSAHRFGFLGGFFSAFVLSLVYNARVYHAHESHGQQLLQPVIEILMMYTLGLFSGIFAQKLYREKEKLRLVSEELKQSLHLVESSTVEKIRLEKEFAKADRLRVLGQLTAGIAHEIRNPLAAIKSGVQLIKSGKQDAKIADLLIAEIERLNVFVERFLQYARVGKDQEADIDAGDLAEEMVELARLLCKDRPNVRFESAVGEVSGVVMRGDRNYLKQALLNILVNAIEAADTSGSEGSVIFSAGVDGDTVLFTVKDNGKGVSDDAAEKIFEPFFTTKEIGTGLGLTIAAKVIREHNGEIAVLNDKGAQFTVRIPGRPA